MTGVKTRGSSGAGSFGRRVQPATGEQGQSVVVMAVSMTMIMAMLALIIDGGYAFSQRRQVQNAADAGALAGVRVLWVGGSATQAQAAACDYASRNQATVCQAEVPNANSVLVTASHRFNTFFAGALGYRQLTAQAIAAANVRTLVPDGNLWPMIVKTQEFQTCRATDPCGSVNCPKYRIWDSERDASGNAGWVDWNGQPFDARSLAEAMRNPSLSGHWDIGDWVWGDPGLKDSYDVRQAIEDQRCKHVTVPVWDQITGEGANTRYRIAGFAEFLLTDYKLTGTPKWVTGQFVRWTEPGASLPAECTTGLCAIRLSN